MDRRPRRTAGPRAQAPPVMLAERHGRRGSQATWWPALSLPAAVPVGYGPCAESPASDLLWRLAAGDCLMGFNPVSWGVNSAARSSGPVCEAAAAVRELPGSSGRLSPQGDSKIANGSRMVTMSNHPAREVRCAAARAVL